MREGPKLEILSIFYIKSSRLLLSLSFISLGFGEQKPQLNNRVFYFN
jgi:hypothetical protein